MFDKSKLPVIIPVSFNVLITRIYHAYGKRINESVWRVTVWHHKALPIDAVTLKTDLSIFSSNFFFLP